MQLGNQRERSLVDWKKTELEDELRWINNVIDKLNFPSPVHYLTQGALAGELNRRILKNASKTQRTEMLHRQLAYIKIGC